jgi:acetate---CoA ligase (ADP-forming)
VKADMVEAADRADGTTAALNLMFRPASIAVIGVSASVDVGRMRYANQVLANLEASDFSGSVMPVGPRLSAAGSYTDVSLLPEPADMAFLAVPAHKVAAAVEDCARAGIRFVVVGTAGFTETASAEGAAHLGALRSVAKETGVRVVGPVSSGFYNVSGGISVGYNPSNSARFRPGGIAVFGHSGAFLDPLPLLVQAGGGGLSLLCASGLEVDVSVLDLAEYGLADRHTRVIGLVLDSVADGARLRRLALAAARVGKTIVVLKIGTSARGAELAVAHSSRLAGDNDKYDEFFRACGIAVTRTLESFAAAACLLERYGPCTGALASVINSGAGASLLADRAHDYRVPVATLSPEASDRLAGLRRFAHTNAPPNNPVDLGVMNQGEEARKEILSALSEDPGVGIMLGVALFPDDATLLSFAASLDAGRTADNKPFIMLCPTGLAAGGRAELERGGVPLVSGTDDCMQAIAALLAQGHASMYSDDSQLRDATRASTAQSALAAVGARPALTEAESLRVLAECGLPTVPMYVCDDEESVVAAALELGWPVVVKGVEEGTTHKTERGLVHLDLADLDAVKQAYAALGRGQALVQRQVKPRAEAIVGFVASQETGPMLVAGLGGIYAEQLQDTCLWAVPASREAVRTRLLESTLGRIVTSTRWPREDTLDALVGALMSVQEAAQALGSRVTAIDVNPMVLGDDGVVAVDALVTLRSQ